MKAGLEPLRQNHDQRAVLLQPILLSARQAAAFCGVSLSTWWSLDSAGQIPRKLRVGKRCLWRRRDLELWSKWGVPNRETFEQRKGALEQQVVGNVSLMEGVE
jgi:predicted DNA-binding transcriptional regulator AlpA